MMKLSAFMAAMAAGLAVAPCGAAGSDGMKTPETSRLFVRHVDSSTGVESWILKPGIFSFHQQGYYFTQRSMTDDGRFLLLWARDSEYEADGKTKKAKRRHVTAMIDFATDTIIELKGVRARVAFMDVKTDQIWYFNKAKDSADSVVCRRDLLIDPLKEIELCRVPEALIRGAKKIYNFSNHPTLTKDRKKMFISAHLDDRFEYGCINLETGAWERWGIAPFYANHDQLNPVRDDLAMVAWEGCRKSPDGIEYMKKTGWYPRMWHVRPDGSRELQPSRIPGHNSATHEHWSEDGKGFYWCAGGVHYQDLATGAQETVEPWPAYHAAMSSDNRLVTFDCPVDKWYRGCQWQVGFWNRDAKRGLYIHAFCPKISDDDGGGHDHPDPHPSFVCNDRYVLCTMNGPDRRMNLSLTPVAPLVARTAIDPDSFFAKLPSAARPQTVATRLAEHFLECPADDYKPKGYKYRNYGGKLVEYPLVSLWVNSLANARLMGNTGLEKRLIEHFEPFLGEKKEKQSPMNHVDYSVFGALPLQIAILNGDERCLKLGLKYANKQWTPPDDSTVNAKHALPLERQKELWKAGYTPQTRLWIDDMYMITLLQLQAYRATGNKKYLARTMHEMSLYIDELQLNDGPAAGLFYHAPDVPFVWGRGAGWMAAGMALLLSEAPAQNGDWHVIMEGYRKMMAVLLKHQRASGLWGQLVNDPESWDETSGSAMYTYAFVEGVRHGWLEPDIYGPAARKAWLALVKKLDEYGNLKDVCIGTGKRNDRAWYMGRPREAGDPHGQAAMSWICRALMEIETAR